MTTERSVLSVTDLQGSQKRNRSERLTKAVLRMAAGVSVVISLGIVAVLVVRSAGFLRDADWSDLYDPSGCSRGAESST